MATREEIIEMVARLMNLPIEEVEEMAKEIEEEYGA